jgi:uncharacterized delta-60 repeat protein
MTFDGFERIDVTGYSQDATGVLNMRVWRYSGSGVLDPTLSVSHAGNAAPGVGQTAGLGIAVDATGRIVVCGYSIGHDGLWGMTLWRYLEDGTPDTTFAGGAGYLRDAYRQGGGVSCAIDGSGRIVVAGFAWSGVDWDMAVWRFEPNGDVDPALNGIGFQTHHGAAGGSGEDIGIGLLIDAQGRILVTGYSTNSLGDQDLVVWRLLGSDGALDAAFNGTGYATFDTPGIVGTDNDVGRALAIDALQRIVVAGWRPGVLPGTDDMGLWRFNDNGSRDTAFNVIHDGAAGSSGTDEGRAIALDGAGRIVVTGSSTNAAGALDVVIWRYLPNGTLDTTLNGTGFVVLPGTTVNEGARDLGIDSLGRLWAVGFRGNALASAEVALWSLSP